MPVPSEQSAATCANCWRRARRRPALLPGLRPAVLAGAAGVPRCAERRRRSPGRAGPAALERAGTIDMGSGGFLPPERGAAGWLRRYSGLIGLLTVLLMCLLVGLLVGHWVTQSKTPGAAGLQDRRSRRPGYGARARGAAVRTSTSPASRRPRRSKSSAGQGSQRSRPKAAKETAEEKARLRQPKKLSSRETQKTEQHHGQEARGRNQHPRRPADRNGLRRPRHGDDRRSRPKRAPSGALPEWCWAPALSCR